MNFSVVIGFLSLICFFLPGCAENKEYEVTLEKQGYVKTVSDADIKNFNGLYLIDTVRGKKPEKTTLAFVIAKRNAPTQIYFLNKEFLAEKTYSLGDLTKTHQFKMNELVTEHKLPNGDRGLKLENHTLTIAYGVEGPYGYRVAPFLVAIKIFPPFAQVTRPIEITQKGTQAVIPFVGDTKVFPLPNPTYKSYEVVGFPPESYHQLRGLYELARLQNNLLDKKSNLKISEAFMTQEKSAALFSKEGADSIEAINENFSTFHGMISLAGISELSIDRTANEKIIKEGNKLIIPASHHERKKEVMEKIESSLFN